MSSRKNLLRGSVSAFALFATAGMAQAQDAAQVAPAAPAATQVAQAAPAPAPLEAEQIVVTGIRASLQKSMEVKRNADGIVEAVSAEDIGRLPDKNIGDAVQRLPGITTIQSAAAGSGGFGENDRVEIRGTAPSLTNVTLNGHSVSSGDWFILDQLNTSSRSVSTSLFPTEIVDRIEVHKSSQADDPEGGTAGTLEIITRTPLGFADQYTAQLTAGASYSSMADKAGPDLNGLLNWKNTDNTFGVMIQGFYSDKYNARAGQEILGYSAIPDTAAFPAAIRGALFPDIINTSYFQQERKKEGGDFAIEWKPTSQWDIKFDGFYDYMNAPNFNQGDLTAINNLVNNGVAPTSSTVSNGVLTSATFPGSAAYGQPGINDIYRPDAIASSYYINLDGTYKPTANLILHGQVGYTQGKSGTNQWALGTTGNAASGVAYALNGTSSPLSLSFPGNPSINNPANYTAFGGNGNQDWVGDTTLAYLDTEGYGQLDAEYLLDEGIIQSVKAGVRVTEHTRNSTETEAWSGCYNSACNLSVGPISNGLFPTGGFNSAGIPIPFTVSVDPNLMKNEVLNAILTNVPGGQGSELGRFYFPGAYGFKEDTDSGYLMAKMGGSNWQGNAGVRITATQEAITTYDTAPLNASVPPITTSLFGTYYKNPHENDYVDILPSMSFKYDLTKEWVARLSASETITRPDYYQLSNPVTLNDQLLTGQGSNPQLKPTRSTNFDVGTEWYYAPESSVSFALFDMVMQQTWDQASSTQTLVNLTKTQNVNNPCGLACPIFSTYNVVSPVNNNGQARGAEVSWQQPLTIGNVTGLGFVANFTYTDSSQNSPTAGIGGRQMLGATRDEGNFTVYYQNDLGDAHLAYTRHSQVYEGLDGRGDKYFLGDGGELDGQLNVNITKNFTASFSALNIADEIEHDVNQYGLPLATYDFGRTFYFSVTAKY
jgi:iron complex outermembrane recepter protein